MVILKLAERLRRKVVVIKNDDVDNPVHILFCMFGLGMFFMVWTSRFNSKLSKSYATAGNHLFAT